MASYLIARVGPRLPALLAAIAAAAGLFILATSAHSTMLAIGLFIAGLSSGLASPALAGAVNDRIASDRQLHVNTTINAGTSGGIILSVPVLFFMPGAGGQPALCSPLWRCCACRLCGGICRHLRRNPVSQRQRCYLSYANPACFGCWGLPLSAVWPAPHGGALARKYLCVTRSWIAQRPMFSG